MVLTLLIHNVQDAVCTPVCWAVMHLPAARSKTGMTHALSQKKNCFQRKKTKPERNLMRCSGAIIVLFSQSNFLSQAHYEKEMTATHHKINKYM